MLVCMTSARATTYYVATDGNDLNDGKSITTPFKTIAKAAGIVAAGDFIYVRGGKYLISSTVTLSAKGNANALIRLEGYNNERPLFYCAGLSSGKRGFALSGNYWYIKGIDITKATDNGMIVSGAYNTVEFCTFYENGDSGLQLSSGANNNKVINCDSYYNADPPDYGDADGFACKMDVGTGNYFYGCRAWQNCDDGWDGYLRGANDVTTTVENCWTWMNGYLKNGTDPGSQANGNGFKMGGSDDKTLKHNFVVNNCLCFDNKAKGFDQNNNKGNMTVYNGTAFRNKGNNFSVPIALASGKICKVVNGLSFSGGISLGSFVSQTTNSWLINTPVTENDFMSIDTTGVSGKRKADGSLPDLDFMKLRKGSALIDAGTDVGVPFLGKAPDLGAFEFNDGTSVEDLFLNNVADAFFNNGFLNVKCNLKGKTGNAVLYDLNGIKLWNKALESDYSRFDCGHISTGFYLLEVSTGNIKSRFKLIKK